MILLIMRQAAGISPVDVEDVVINSQLQYLTVVLRRVRRFANSSVLSALLMTMLWPTPRLACHLPISLVGSVRP